MNRLSALLITSLASISSFADWEVNMPRGVSPTANAAYDLHMLIFYITVVIGIVVFWRNVLLNIPSQKIKRSQTIFVS